MKKDKVVVGQVRNTNEGGSFTVVEVVSAKEIYIVHNDEHKHKAKVSADQVRNGIIRNPYFPTLYGVGYMGVGKHKSKIKGVNVPHYSVWTGAIIRCYCPTRQAKRPSYIGCSISKNWLCYQNFAEWYTTHESYGLGYELDKDLLVKGNRVYSAETCTMIPREINLAIRTDRIKVSDLPVGVLKTKSGSYTAGTRIKGKDSHIGTFKTLEEASAAYVIAKEAHVKELALEWEDRIEPRAFKALMNWTVY